MITYLDIIQKGHAFYALKIYYNRTIRYKNTCDAYTKLTVSSLKLAFAIAIRDEVMRERPYHTLSDDKLEHLRKAVSYYLKTVVEPSDTIDAQTKLDVIILENLLSRATTVKLR